MGERAYSVQASGEKVVISGREEEIEFRVSDPSRIDLRDGSFAAWALLPFAMASGDETVIDIPGDAETEENARHLTRIWSTWMPKLFRPASIRFTSHAPAERSASERDLLLFSGGVDSTYNLLRRRSAGLKQSLLTVHGLDYHIDDDARFRELVEKTNPVAQATGSTERLLVKTNLFHAYRREKISHIGILHGFVLASCLFLARGGFRSGEISADYSHEQEPLVFPWGTNSITNRLFASSAFRMETACLDTTRSGKMQALLHSPEALSSLTFCRIYGSRPHNCGTCSKCIRTKAMFLATTGTIPAIFNEMKLPENALRAINLRSATERAFFLDLAQAAEAKGTIRLVPGLEDRLAELRRPPSAVAVFLERQMNSVRKRLNAARYGRDG